MTVDDISSQALRAAFAQSKSLPGTVTRGHSIMGGHGNITLVGAGETLLSRCWDLAAGCEQLWSRFIPTSDISQLNLAEGHAVEVSPLTRRLVSEMVEGFHLTNGAYDPTLLPALIKAGYTNSLVDPTRITVLPSTARAPGRPEEIVTTDHAVTLPIGTTLDPGGIGKGCAADVIAEFALAEGALGVLVEMGGDIVMRGDAPDGVAWILGIEDPHVDKEHISIVRIKSGAIATSSQLKRRFVHEGQHTHHLLDAHSTTSAATAVQTVTAIAASGARAEVLTKPGFVWEPEEYLAWLPTVGAAGLMTFEDGSTRVSSNWSIYA